MLIDNLQNIPYFPNKIPIVFASDDNYIPYLSTTIQSIIENSSQNKYYIFFILHKGISTDFINLLIKQVTPFNQFLIEFINITDYIKKYDFFISRHVTIETYFRLFIPELFHKYEKIIYLDCDMIVCTDIAELYDINIDNYIIAAMHDIDVINWYYGSKFSKKVKGYRASLSILKNACNYFCAGLCVFNIKLFLDTISHDKIIQVAKSNEWNWHDQDVLNIIAENKVLLLSFHWGFYNTNHINYLPNLLLNEYIEAKNNPKIIHFVKKPWIFNRYINHFEYFWKYATRTPFINLIINKMRIENSLSLNNEIIDNITYRKGIGIKFLLFDCLKAWLFRKKI